MPKFRNPAWRFFASVKLALLTLIILAAISIFGTLIKQGQPPSYYVQEYGESLARIFEATRITNMYGSWWFLALVSIFAANLLVCSIDRLPGVWQMVVKDNLATDPTQLEKMSTRHLTNTSMQTDVAAARLLQALVGAGWKQPRRLDLEGSSLLFVQKGAWSRLGVYVVHLSILVILIGVLIGTLFGYQAYVFLPEGKATSNIFLRKSKEPVPLGFELQCDRFEKTLYPNGMLKEYRADLTVLDPERETPYRKSIIVNDPLSYGGLTFYLGDSYPLEEYSVIIRDRTTGAEQAFRVPPDREVAWSGAGISFRLEELKLDQDGAIRQAKIRFATDDSATPSIFWMGDKATMTIGRPEGDFTFSLRQLYSTLLLAKKDQGVLIVFVGCGLMVVGLIVSFFLSHRRIWVRITPRGKKGSRILFSGVSNKNKPAFEQKFRKLVGHVEQEMADAREGKNGGG